jgi:hypothetical protein
MDTTASPVPPQPDPPPLPERQPGESGRWYQRFLGYVALGPGRSLLASYRAAQAVREGPKRSASSAPPSWRSAADAWKWRGRAEQWDLLVLEQRRRADALAFAAEIDRHRQNAVAVARALIGIDVDGLKLMAERLSRLKSDEIKPESVPAFLRALAAVGDSALNAECLGLGALELAKSLNGSH